MVEENRRGAERHHRKAEGEKQAGLKWRLHFPQAYKIYTLTNIITLLTAFCLLVSVFVAPWIGCTIKA